MLIFDNFEPWLLYYMVFISYSHRMIFLKFKKNEIFCTQSGQRNVIVPGTCNDAYLYKTEQTNKVNQMTK